MNKLGIIKQVREMQRKGNISPGMLTLVVGVIMLVVAGFVLSIGASIITTQQATQTSGTYAYNASGYTLQGLNTVAQQQSSVAGVLILAVFIAILFGVLGYVAFKQS